MRPPRPSSGRVHGMRPGPIRLRSRIATRSMPSPVRRLVEQALHGEHRLRVARPPDRRDRHLVGQRRARDQPVGRNVVGQRHRERGLVGQVGAARGIGAVVVHHGSAHAADRSVGVERSFDVPELIAFLGAGDEMLAPVLDPLDRPPEQEGGERDGDLLRVGHQLGPEPAADRRRDHADAPRLAAKHAGDQVAPGMGRLGRAPEGEQVVRRVAAGERAATLDRMPAAAMDRQVLGEHAVGPGKGGLDIAERHGQLGEQVVIRAAMHGRRGRRQRIAAVGDDREGVVTTSTSAAASSAA